jgi:16S rRNA (guanine(966)-N(2))-methyltransferase RsmD
MRAGEVRIIAGQWKRTRLRVLPRPGLRPTPDRVRETLFNWLGTDLSGWRVLDAFAGSGALGLEAASRGAAQVVLLDNDAHAVRELASIHQRLHAPGGVQVERADALVWMARSPPGCFELVLLDPPFDSPLAAPAVAMAQRLLVPGGLLMIEAPQYLSPLDPGIEVLKQMKAGAVHLQLLQVGRSDPTAMPAGQ